MDYAVQQFGRRGRVIRAWDKPLQVEQLLAEVPSLGASQAHSSRTEKYSFIPTLPLLERLEGEGFYPMEVRAGYSRDYDRMGYVKHLVRLRPATHITTSYNALFPEVILLNSHDGSTGFKLLAGWFRLVCLNGLVVGDNEFPSLDVPHRGDTSEVIEAAYKIVDSFPAQAARIEEMQRTTLPWPARESFAREAALLRWQGGQVAPLQLLDARREADLGDSLWQTFNRVQENMVKGGIKAWSRSGRPHRRQTRPVHAIHATLSLNQSLWSLATRYLDEETRDLASVTAD
jgi:hypothetical protein